MNVFKPAPADVPLSTDLRGRRLLLSQEQRRERRLEANRRWRMRNPEAARAYRLNSCRKNYLQNRERILLQQAEYRARKRADRPAKIKPSKTPEQIAARKEQMRAYRRAYYLAWVARQPKNPRVLKSPDKRRETLIAWRRKNADRLRQVRADWFSRNRERILAGRRKKYREKKAAGTLWCQVNKGARNEIARRWARKARKDPAKNIHMRMSQGVRASLNGDKRFGVTWLKFVDYTLDQLRSHLESQFTDGMSWERFVAKEIHIDHIMPKSRFKFTTPNDPQFRACWALSNLRPMWAHDNLSKHAMTDEEWAARKAMEAA